MAKKSQPNREPSEKLNSKILLVEDNNSVRKGYKATLEELGYQVTDVADRRLATQCLESGERFDLLMSDLNMPPSNNVQEGIILLSYAQSNFQPTKLIAYSAYLQDYWVLHRLLALGVSFLEWGEWNDRDNLALAIRLTLRGWFFYSPFARKYLVEMFKDIRQEQFPLTEWETLIAARYLQGAEIKQISDETGTAETTIRRKHLDSIRRKANIVATSEIERQKELLAWFKSVCARYDLRFDEKGSGIDLSEWRERGWRGKRHKDKDSAMMDS